MSKPHQCPKCNGFGWLQYDPNYTYFGHTTVCGPWQCNACVNGIIWETETVAPVLESIRFIKKKER